MSWQVIGTLTLALKSWSDLVNAHPTVLSNGGLVPQLYSVAVDVLIVSRESTEKSDTQC
jgi:hypothetical protein